VILIDSSVWIDHFRGAATQQTNKLAVLLGTVPVLVGDLVLAEVLQGFRNDLQFDRALRLLTSLQIVDLAGPYIAVQAAKNFRTLRHHGITVRKTIDSLIATCCIERGHSLLYSDRDFDPFVSYLGLRSAMP
jgi:predicted nucleic acid-binding protein